MYVINYYFLYSCVLIYLLIYYICSKSGKIKITGLNEVHAPHVPEYMYMYDDNVYGDPYKYFGLEYEKTKFLNRHNEYIVVGGVGEVYRDDRGRRGIELTGAKSPWFVALEGEIENIVTATVNI